MKFITPQPTSTSPAIQHGADQSWTNPITNKAATCPAEALKKDPRKNPLNVKLGG